MELSELSTDDVMSMTDGVSSRLVVHTDSGPELSWLELLSQESCVDTELMLHREGSPLTGVDALLPVGEGTMYPSSGVAGHRNSNSSSSLFRWLCMGDIEPSEY